MLFVVFNGPEQRSSRATSPKINEPASSLWPAITSSNSSSTRISTWNHWFKCASNFLICYWNGSNWKEDLEILRQQMTSFKKKWKMAQFHLFYFSFYLFLRLWLRYTRGRWWAWLASARLDCKLSRHTAATNSSVWLCCRHAKIIIRFAAFQFLCKNAQTAGPL